MAHITRDLCVSKTFIYLSTHIIIMEAEKLAELITKAREAVNKASDLNEEQKKIAFQTILSELIRSGERASPIPEATPLRQTQMSGDAPSKSIEELYNEIKPQGHSDTVLFLSYYFHKQGKTFTTNDILEGYRKILVPTPANPKDIINKNRKKGFIMFINSDDKGRTIMQITRTGILYVENGFRRDKNGNA